MSPAMQLKYAALRRQLNRARQRGEMKQVQPTQQLIAQLVASSLMRLMSLSWGRAKCSLMFV
jgi:hypothetical protein